MQPKIRGAMQDLDQTDRISGLDKYNIWDFLHKNKQNKQCE